MTLEMNSKIEVFPTPVSPTRRMVYGSFALFFDVLIVPSLRDFTSLGNRVRTDAPEEIRQLLDSRGVRSPVDRHDGKNAVTGETAILVSSYRRPKFHGETHALGDIAWRILWDVWGRM